MQKKNKAKFALYTAPRQDECMGFEWKNLDLDVVV